MAYATRNPVSNPHANVVGVLTLRDDGDQVARRGQQLQADKQREEATNKEEEGNRDQEEERDALVVHSQEPRLGPMTRIQVVLAFSGIRYYGCRHFLITYTFPALFRHFPN